MTIEELIKEQDVFLGNGYHSFLYYENVLKLAKEIRRLTIEECKATAKIKTGYWRDGCWKEEDVEQLEIDSDSFPTDLTNIDI